MTRRTLKAALFGAVCVTALSGFALADNFVLQSTFSITGPNNAGMDTDSVGSIYVLSDSATTTLTGNYVVTSYSTPNILPLFSFNTGVPVNSGLDGIGYAVEASGTVDLMVYGINGSAAYTLFRFSNTGVPISQQAIPYSTVSGYFHTATAIDKINQRVYIAQHWSPALVCLVGIGSDCPTPPYGWQATINQYDFSGHLLHTITMPGSMDVGGCYSPAIMTVNAQGDLLVEDNVCNQIFTYSPTGSQLSDVSPSGMSVGPLWTDPNGDVYVNYQNVCVGSACNYGVTEFSSSGQPMTSFAVNAGVSISVDQRTAYISGSNGLLSRYILDGTPTVPAPISPIGNVGQHSATATLSWQASTEPDGDPITYTVLFGNSPNQLQALATGLTGTSLTTPPLSFGTNYYWQVVAQDYYDNLPVQQTASPTESFSLTLQDGPPAAFGVIAASGTAVTRATSVQLSWQSTTNPYGDPIVYNVFWSTSQSLGTAVGTTTATTWPVSNLGFGTTYYWSVQAVDPFGESAWMSNGYVQSYLQIFENLPPGPFSVTAGSGTVVTRATTDTLGWTASTDPDGDSVSYGVYFGTSAANLPLLSTTTQTSLPVGPLAFATTYYWQVQAFTALGSSATMTGGTQTLLHSFLNLPPSAPVNMTQTGTVSYHGTSPSLSFFWQPATDPEGDPIGYEVYLGTSQASMAQVPNAALGYTATGLATNTAYYYEIVASNPYGAVSVSSVNWVYFQFVDSPPGNFSVVAGSGTAVTRATSDTLDWTAASDAYGDPIGYQVYFGTSASSLPLVATTQQTSYVANGLSFGATYYWSVSAFDPYGSSMTIAGSTQAYLLSFADLPPAPPIYLSTASVLELHTSSPTFTFSWEASSNPFGDPISYEFDISTGTGYTPIEVGTATALTNALVFETTYQWRVIADDPYGGASTGAWQSVIAHLENQPPYPIVYTSTTATLATRTTTYVLTWEATGDPDGDPTTYSLYLSTTGTQQFLTFQSTQTSYSLNLSFGTTYYWRVSATDDFGATTAGALQAFLPVFLNSPPEAPDLISPFSASPVVKTMSNSVAVSWQQVTDPEGDPIDYTIYFGNSAQNLSPVASISQTNQSGEAVMALRPLAATPQAEVTTDSNTVTLSLTGLAYYQTYYLQVAAANPYGAVTMTGVQTFTLASEDGFPAAYNYPNPFSPLRGGTNLVFNAPPSGYAQATVEVYSEWQALLFKQVYYNIPPGISQIPFSGYDRYGKPFFNGSYICRVLFSGPDNTQVFYLLVVK